MSYISYNKMENQILILTELKYLGNKYSIMAITMSRCLGEMDPGLGKQHRLWPDHLIYLAVC